ncbi:hypothetical protein PV04_10368 [Phialophora macrospora]|uniref:Methyltransferase domain-containing protein n=1 Tax=Phialophora macrospora TaxID=1851006 RepID=A0A0D2F2K0_9EURO|nr:hypothetical protein PV04_10368 [Phialophora macrospora]
MASSTQPTSPQGPESSTTPLGEDTSGENNPAGQFLPPMDQLEDGIEVDSKRLDFAYVKHHSRYLGKWTTVPFIRQVTYVAFSPDPCFNSSHYLTIASEYAFPNDEAEAERLDMQHAMQSHLLGDRLFWAPIGDTPQRVVDLGTGTGIWAIDFADMFPSADVVGTDLSNIQPTWVPPNCRFEIDDAEAEWTWPENHFDYIHNRNFVCAIRDWPSLIQKTYQHVAPGGWVEWHEKHPEFLSDDNSLAPDSALSQWSTKFFEASVIFGADAHSPRNLRRWMEETGFVDVEEHILKLPLGSWPREPRLKRCGLFEMVNMTQGIQALTVMLFTRCLGMTPNEVELFLMSVRKDVKDKSIHSYYHFYVVFGRKPPIPQS